MVKIEVLVEGGKASPAPPLGPKLGELKMNVAEVVNEINKMTASFKGMKVPVKVDVNDKTKEYKISIGTPPTSELLKKEIGIEKASGEPNKQKAANMAIEQIIKVAKMKMTSLSAHDLKNAVKIVVGNCSSMGILIEGKEPKVIIKEINDGKYDSEIKAEKTEADDEKIRRLKEETKALQKAIVPKEKVEKKEAKGKAGDKEAKPAAAAAPAKAPAKGSSKK